MIIFSGVVLIIFGVVAFFCAMIDVLNNDTGKPLPIQDMNGLVVDSSGNIYIADGSTFNIQIFDPAGQFQSVFDISYEEKELFEIAMDENDIFHVLTDEMHRTYKDGNLQSVEDISYDGYELLQERYKFTDGSSYKTENKSYVFLILNRVLVSSSEGRQLIKLELPWWPLSPFMAFVIMFIGYIMIEKCVKIKKNS